jgi:predicted RND superfamily exporter protein
VSALVAWAIDRRRLVVALAALAALAALPGVARLESDNSPAVYLTEGTPEAARHAAFRGRFGGGDGVRLVVTGPALWSPDGLAELARLEAAAAALPGVERASSIVRRHAAELPEFPPADPAAWRDALVHDPFDRGMGWISADGAAASVLVETAPLSARDDAALAGRLAELARGARAGLAVTAVGPRSLERALDRSARTIATRYLPALALFAALLLAAALRDARSVLVPLAVVALCETVVLGAAGWAGVRFHLVLAILPPVLFVVALASAVHLAIRCRAREAAGESARAAALHTFAEKGRSLLFAAAAIAGGFAALATSGVAPVAELGRWAALGVGVQLATALVVLPALLSSTTLGRTRRPERALEERLERLGRALAAGAVGRRATTVAAALALAAAALAGLPRLAAESDIAHAFAADHPVRRAIDLAEGHGLGVARLELDLVAARGDERFDSPPALARLGELVGRLVAEPGVLSASSAAELALSVGAASPWAALATPEELRGQALAVLAEDEEGRAALRRFLTADGGAARVVVFVRWGGFDQIEPLATRAEALARGFFPHADVAATGTLRRLLGFHRALLATLASSLALALPFLFALFWLALGRPWPAAKALVPNLWPVAVLLGGMGWLGVRLDLATVMVASIVLGLAVENTVHTLSPHARDVAAHGSPAAAIVARLERAAPAYVLTFAILATGFGVCGLSDFAPIARFGMLSALGLALALAADLVLVPALFGGAVRAAQSPR